MNKELDLGIEEFILVEMFHEVRNRYQVFDQSHVHAPLEAERPFDPVVAFLARKPNIRDEEKYDEIFGNLTSNTGRCLAGVQFFASGEIHFKALIYVPKPHKYTCSEPQVRLYSNGALVSKGCDLLVYPWLCFLVGAVDVEGLTGRTQRDILRENKKIFEAIKTDIGKNLLAALFELQNNNEQIYGEIYEDYEMKLLTWAYYDIKNRPALLSLLRFYTNKSGPFQISLKQYVQGMQHDQNEIFYFAGNEFDELRCSPLIADYIIRGIEVLFFIGPHAFLIARETKQYGRCKLTNINQRVEVVDVPPEEEAQDMLPACASHQMSDQEINMIEIVQVADKLEEKHSVTESIKRNDQRQRKEKDSKRSTKQKKITPGNLKAKRKAIIKNLDKIICERL